MKLLAVLAVLASLATSAAPLFSADPAGARITHALRDVRLADPATASHAAAPQEIVADGATLRTGAGSRAELTFADRTVTRLGADTALGVRSGTRDLRLDHGTVLLDIPQLHPAARLHAGALTASGSGATALLAHAPGSSVKVVVLAGRLRLTVDGWLGDSITLAPGKMLIVKPGVRTLPEPVDVDVDTLVKTASLIDAARFPGAGQPAVAPLPSLPLIARTIARQAALRAERTLFPTNLAIRGSGTAVTLLGGENADDAKPKIATRSRRPAPPGGKATAQNAPRPAAAASAN